MATINPTIPTIGQPNATEDQDIVTALNTIVAVINGNLDSQNLAVDAVSTAEIADNAISKAKMQDNSVGNAELEDLAVNTAELANSAVTNAKLASDAVTNVKVAAAAAIAYSKLATLNTGQILAGNAGVPTASTLSGAATVGATGALSLTKDYRVGSVTTIPTLGTPATVIGLDTQLAAGTWFVISKVDVDMDGSAIVTIDLEYNAVAIDHTRFQPGTTGGGQFFGNGVVMGQVVSNGSAFTRIRVNSGAGGEVIFSAWLAIRVA